MSRRLVVALVAASGCATAHGVDETALRMDEVLDFKEKPAEPIALGPTAPVTPDLPEPAKAVTAPAMPGGMYALRPGEPPDFVTTVRGRRARPHHGVPKIGIPDVVIPEVQCGTVDCGKVEIGPLKIGEITIGDPIGEIRFMKVDL